MRISWPAKSVEGVRLGFEAWSGSLGPLLGSAFTAARSPRDFHISNSPFYQCLALPHDRLRQRDVPIFSPQKAQRYGGFVCMTLYLCAFCGELCGLHAATGADG